MTWLRFLTKRHRQGKEKPVRIYRVIAPSSRRTRFDVSAEKGLTGFVGRERELELLIDGFERTKSGRGQVVSVTGEAGVGKSRLLYEFRKAIANEEVTFLEGKCLSYSRGAAYYPVIDILKSNFEVAYNSLLSKRRKKIHARIGKALESIQAQWWRSFHYLYLGKIRFEMGDQKGSLNAVQQALKISQDTLKDCLLHILG